LPLLNNAVSGKITKYGGYGYVGDYIKLMKGKRSSHSSHVKALVHHASYIDSKIVDEKVLKQRIDDHEVAAFGNDPSGQDLKANAK
jgi:hypothetical protein